ncbi:MAG: DNA polymerase/3'-5' exonuclease PolX [Bacteroidetes bacterium]|nr:DNA polymerase/3'-5' exonuclease PolX [Bacteroidota bacterium]MBS1757324.1 DNA polymerase/3'-5' exonuclease PolX [Bacteroidota bacterium]
MNNYEIADSFSLLSKLMDIHGENSFKAKSYASTAFAIEKLTTPLSEIPKENIATLKGIGASGAQKIMELLDTGRLKMLEELILNTPKGVIEMLNIKGIGPKKIHTIWKEMEIESIGELLYACKENRLKLYKGFGEKTQQNVIEKIEFYLQNMGSHLYASAEKVEPFIKSFLQKIFGDTGVITTGQLLMQNEIINELEFVIIAEEESIEKSLKQAEGFTLKNKENNFLCYDTPVGIDIKIYPANEQNASRIFLQTSSPVDFMALLDQKGINPEDYNKEAEVLKKEGKAYLPPYLRDNKKAIQYAMEGTLPGYIQQGDVKGIIHCHSNWSDGSNTIEEMAQAAISRGLEYLVISDHSKSAFYAQGLHEDKIKAQHEYIDELNEKLAPFKIFKSIESDILNDGNLDYSPAVLSTFDLVIGSVHSNLKMPEEKAMKRLLTAIENPYTTILGHMTGRLLLSRPGYPVNHHTIIDACAANNVVIELNAHPSRLDIDWRYIEYALEKNVLISIDPDAHVTDGLDDIRYGILVAQKAMLPKEMNLSSYSLARFEAFIAERKKLKNI